MKRHHNRIYVVLITIIAALVLTMPVFAAVITIDGNFGDWAGSAGLSDPGGADDEKTPSRADITELRAESDSSGLYLLKAWDDTSFTGGQETTAGVSVRGADNNVYRIYTTAQGNPGTVPLSSLDMKSCTDETCASQTDICTDTGCTGAQAGSGATWTDPFASRPTPDCTGTNCDTLDTAVELFIPWNLIGGVPVSGESTVFIQFGSYPSGPGQAPKDDFGDFGITCLDNGESFDCYPSTPSIVKLERLETSPSMVNSLQPTWIAVGVALMAAIFGSSVWILNRSRVRDR